MPKQYPGLVLANQIADLVRDSFCTMEQKKAALEIAKVLIEPGVLKFEYPDPPEIKALRPTPAPNS